MPRIDFTDLTPMQQQVADLTAPTALVLGGAGVGKTTTALWAARREITGHGGTAKVPTQRVLFVTFSRTAVAQIRSRSGGVLAGITEAVEILTFHGLAFRLLTAFGRYAGIGSEPPSLLGEARSKLLQESSGVARLAYGQLLPSALRLLEATGPISDLIKSRWAMVICDEFQDTDDDEWRLLQCLGEKARLLLLADPNQMIYGFKNGVTDARLDAARARPGCVEHSLPPGSHRDPTQVLPDAASEARWRRFSTTPVVKAVTEGRLLVYAAVPDSEGERAAAIVAEVERLRRQGHATIGIYAKTNTDAAELSYGLLERGLDHVPIGFSEAYGEALVTMVLMVQYAAGAASWDDVRTALGVTLTANVRSSTAPNLAIYLRDGVGYPAAFGQQLLDLADSLNAAGRDVAAAAAVATGSWDALGFLNGRRAWRRAARTFRSAVARAQLEQEAQLERLSTVIAGIRDASFVELDAGDGGAIQLMNFSQTKGREADATILSFTSRDYYGRGGEPYDEPSRILYVSMTRARHKVVVMLPPTPHPLVAPLMQFAVGLP